MKLLDTFMATVDESLRSLGEAVSRKDFVQLAEVSHKLKGSAGNMRLTFLAGLAAEIEVGSERREEIDYQGLIGRMQGAVKNIGKLLKN